MRRRRAIAIAVGAAAGLVAPPLATVAPATEPYSLPRTEVVPLRSELTGQEHVLYVSLPRDVEAGSERRYPTVFLLDADYSFAIAHNVVEHFVDRGNLPPMILVGIAYPGKSQDRDTYRRHRSRDYTPTHTLEGGYGPDFQKASGNGPRFRDFIVDELAPWVEARYPADPDDRVLVGHSYGGLFTTFVLLTRPEAFHRYLVVSPSYWYDVKVVFRLEAEAAEGRDDLPVRAAFLVGEHERNSRWDLVGDLDAFVRTLRGRDYPGLRLYHHVFPDETHNSVFPAALTRGLRVLFD